LTEAECFTVEKLKKEGMSAAKIARILGRSDTSVKNCLKRLRLTDNSSYLKRKSSGRKPLVNKRYERLIIRKVKSNPSMRRMTKRSLAAEFQSPPIAPSTLVKTLKKNGFKSYIARKKPFLTKKAQRERYNWAKEHKNWTKEDWRRVLWTDESSVSTDSNGKIRVWRRKEEVYDQSCTQATVKSGRKSIMVWGCVNGYNLPHLVRCPPRMNGEAYGEIIVDAVYPIIMATDDAIFQEDGARIHISKPVKKIKAELGIVPMKWPPYSPDLSPIENVWREVKCWIHKNRKPRNQTDLEEAVTAAWNNVAFETTLQFIDSMPDRVKEVIKKKG
ncbi:17287_t:CDS:1, partial [Racocetra fulgida]